MGAIGVHEYEALREELNRLRGRIDGLQLGHHPAGGGWKRLAAADLADNTGVIASETPAVGATATAKRSDAADGLKLVGNPGDFVEDAATGDFVPTLEFVKDNAAPVVRRGARVRLAAGDTGYADGMKFYAKLLAATAAGHVTKSGLCVPLDDVATTGCLRNASGVLQLQKGDGLEIAANILKVLLATNPGLEFDSGGLRLKLGSAGDILYCDGSKWLSLAKDAGKYLKSGAAAVSWDTPSGAALSTNTPEAIKNGAGDDGDGTAASKDDHEHPCAITGASGWETVGGGSAGKVYAAYK